MNANAASNAYMHWACSLRTFNQALNFLAYFWIVVRDRLYLSRCFQSESCMGILLLAVMFSA